MAGIEELARQYAKRILEAENKKKVINDIINEINDLTYETSGDSISQNSTDILIKLIEEFINTKVSQEDFNKFKNQDIITENTSSSEFNKLIDILTRGTKK